MLVLEHHKLLGDWVAQSGCVLQSGTFRVHLAKLSRHHETGDTVYRHLLPSEGFFTNALVFIATKLVRYF